MKEKILLINTPSDNQYLISAQPPLGILSIASVLRENGMGVAVSDFNVIRNWRRELAVLVEKHAPAIVGLSSAFSNHGAAVEISGLVKRLDPTIRVVVGGPHPTLAPLEYRNENIDYIIPYEGEKVMLAFVRAADKTSVPGVIAVKKGDMQAVFKEIRKDAIENLDDLPFPAFDLVDIRRYQGSIYKKKPMVTLVTSRGCPYDCIFCSKSVFGNKWRAQSAERVVEQISELKRAGVEEVSFEDDNFTFDTGRILRLCDLIRSRGIEIVWQANGIRADRLTKDLLRQMRDAGCWKISFGPEVGDEEGLKKLKKGMTLDHFRRVAGWCRELGIVYECFFMMGLPFQDARGMQKTIDFAIELDPLIMDVNKILPLPDTEVFSQFSDDTILRDRVSFNDRSDNRMLETMYRRAYFSFYARPRKITDIFRAVGLRQFCGLVFYALRILVS